MSKRLSPVRRRGFSLIEVLVGIAVTSIVLSIAMPLLLYSGKSFAGMANYADLNGDSINAMDHLTRDIRQVVSLTTFATNQITLDDGTNGALSFAFTEGTLTRVQGTRTNVLLRGVDFGQFKMYQRTTISNSFDQYPAINVADCKSINVQWKCSRKMVGTSMNTDNEQSAKIVIRKN